MGHRLVAGEYPRAGYVPGAGHEIHQPPGVRQVPAEPVGARPAPNLAVGLQHRAQHSVDGRPGRPAHGHPVQLRPVGREQDPVRQVALGGLHDVPVGLAHRPFQRRKQLRHCLLVVPDVRAVQRAGAADVAVPVERRLAQDAFKSVEAAVSRAERGRAADQRWLGADDIGDHGGQAAVVDRIMPASGALEHLGLPPGEVLHHLLRSGECGGVVIADPRWPRRRRLSIAEPVEVGQAVGEMPGVDELLLHGFARPQAERDRQGRGPGTAGRARTVRTAHDRPQRGQRAGRRFSAPVVQHGHVDQLQGIGEGQGRVGVVELGERRRCGRSPQCHRAVTGIARIQVIIGQQ